MDARYPAQRGGVGRSGSPPASRLPLRRYCGLATCRSRTLWSSRHSWCAMGGRWTLRQADGGSARSASAIERPQVGGGAARRPRLAPGGHLISDLPSIGSPGAAGSVPSTECVGRGIRTSRRSLRRPVSRINSRHAMSSTSATGSTWLWPRRLGRRRKPCTDRPPAPAAPA